jgi:hypothetical protein
MTGYLAAGIGFLLLPFPPTRAAGIATLCVALSFVIGGHTIGGKVRDGTYPSSLQPSPLPAEPAGNGEAHPARLELGWLPRQGGPESMSEPIAVVEALADVDHHTFRIAEEDNYERIVHPEGFRDNGLVVPENGAFLVHAGIAVGCSRVTIALYASPPPASQDQWEDIAEVSVPLRGQTLNVVAREGDGVRYESVTLPPHSGSVRVRAHARGRDIHWDGVASEPIEDYLFQIWPAPLAPSTSRLRSNGRAAT